MPPLSPVQETILSALQAGPLTTEQLIQAVWRGRHEPEFAANNLRVHLVLLNRKLRPEGFQVKHQHPRTGKRAYRNGKPGVGPGMYYLLAIRRADLPVHKQLDPGGVFVG